MNLPHLLPHRKLWCERDARTPRLFPQMWTGTQHQGFAKSYVARQTHLLGAARSGLHAWGRGKVGCL